MSIYSYLPSSRRSLVWISCGINQLMCKTKKVKVKGEREGWPSLVFKMSAKQIQELTLTRLRQKGKPWVMMLMLKILSTFWGGNESAAMILDSARWSAWFSNRSCFAFSLPRTSTEVFRRAPDEKRGMGQCRSIANQKAQAFNQSYSRQNLKKPSELFLNFR